MAELKWRSGLELDPDKEYVVMASRLPLRRFWLLPQFMRYTFAIRKQLHGAHGLVWYSLVAEVLPRRFWTLSVWEDQAALREFVRNMPHFHIMSALRPHLSGQRFVQWTVPASAVPPAWEDARSRLAAA